VTAVLDPAGFHALVEGLGRAWEAHDVEAAVACFTDDAVYMEPPDEQLFRGADELRGYFAPLTPGEYFRIDAWWFDAAEQRGAVEFTFGTEGEPEADHGVALIDVRDGRIARWREYLRRGPASVEAFNATEGKAWRWHAGNYPGED
jgi:ketosteroid isomerase-like protein